jgi:hypothetical protein
MVDGVTGWEGSEAQALRTRTAPEPDEDPIELIGYLESDQLVRERSQPVVRARLSSRHRWLLWALRVFGLALTAMVIYTFVSQLAG